MLKRLEQELAELKARGPIAEFVPGGKRIAGTIEFRGQRVVDLTNWDIFEINQDPQFKLVVQRAVEEFGLGGRSPRLLTGSSGPHFQLELRLAAFMGAEAALIFSSRNQAIFSLVTALLGEQDAILVDELSPGAAADAASLIGCEVVTCRYSDMESVARQLERLGSRRSRVLFFESISGNTGAAVDLTAAVSIARRFGAQLMCDEAFALGLVGLRGAGMCESLAPELRGVLGVRVGDLSVALGCTGGFVAAPRAAISLIRARSRSFLTEIATPPAAAAAAEWAVSAVELKQKERLRLAEQLTELRAGAEGVGFKVLSAKEAGFLALSLPSLREARELHDALFQRGFLTDVVGASPRVGAEGGAIRLVLSTAHTEEQLRRVMVALAEIASRI